MKMLEKLRKAFKAKNLTALKRISNQAIERAALTEDPEMVNISLIAYALYKLLSKPHVLESEQWEAFVKDVDADLAEGMALQEKGEAVGGLLEKDIINDINKIDASLGNYVQDVIKKARMKQASRIYAMGLSLDKAIALTGADRFQLMSYIGATVIHERPFTRTKSVVDRYQTTKKILGEKK
ncbi:MAG: hypothetical protein KAW41_02585 [Candidatus Diapherotrites archaeon]|nr:hypothetical protein [Candidatus Diapherotrites archaeon]